MELTGYATNSAGASAEQFAKTQESLEAKMNRLNNAMKQFYTSLADSTVIKGAIDLLTTFMNTVNKIIEIFSSFPGAIGRVGGVFATLMLTVGGFVGAKRTIEKFFGFLGKSLISFESDAGGTGEKAGAALNKGLTKELVRTPKLFSKTFSEVFGEMNKQAISQRIDRNIFASYADDFQKIQKEMDSLSSKPWSDELLDHYTKLEVRKESLVAQSKIFRQELEREFSPTQLGLMSKYTAQQIAQSEGEARAVILKKTKNSLQAQENALQTGSIRGLLIRVGLTEKENLAEAKGNIIKATKISLEKAWQKVSLANMKAMIANNAAMLMGLAKIALVIGAVVGAFFALRTIIRKVQSNTLDSRMKAAADETERAGEAAERASEAYNELLSSTSRYHELQEGLEELTEGTQEWRDALVEANDQVLELLKTYPSLAQYIHRGEEGRLSIDEEGLKSLEESKRRQKESTQKYDIYAQAREIDLRVEAAEKAFLDSVTGSFASPEMLHKLRDAWAADPTLFESNEAGEYNKLRDLTGFMNITSDHVESLRDALSEYNKEAQSAAIETANLTDMLLGFSKDTKGPVRSAVRSAFSQGLTDETIDARAGELKSKIGSVGTLARDSRVLNEIAELYGVRDQMVGKVTDQVEALYLAVTGFAEVPKDLKKNAEAQLREIAKRVTIDELEGAETEIVEKLEGLSKRSGEIASEITGILSEGGVALTRGVIDSLSEKGEFSPNILKGKMSEYARVMGYETAEEMADAFHMSLEEFEQYLVDNVLYAMKRDEASRSALEEMGLVEFEGLVSSLDSGTYKEFVSKMQSTYAAGGEVDKILKSASRVLSGFSPKQQKEFIESFADTNLKSLDELEALRLGILSINDSVDTTALDGFISQLAVANGAIHDMDTKELTERVTAAGDALASLMDREAGDYQFSEEDYEAIQTAIPGAMDDFVRNLDGTYTYIGGRLESLEDAIRKDASMRLEASNEMLQTQLEASEVIDIVKERALELEGDGAQLEFLLSRLSARGIDPSQLGIEGLTAETDIEKLGAEQIEEILRKLLELSFRQEELSNKLEETQQQREEVDFASRTSGELQRGMGLPGQNTTDTEAMSRALEAQARSAGVADKAIQDYGDSMESSDVKTRKAAAAQLAFEIQVEKVAKQLDELDDVVADHLAELEDLKEGSEAYQAVLRDLAHEFNEILGIELPEDFFLDPENLQLVDDALDGNQQAWERLRYEMLLAQLQSDDFVDAYLENGKLTEEITHALDNLEFSIDGEADMTQVVEALMGAGMAAEDVAKFIEQLGYTWIEFETEQVWVTHTLPNGDILEGYEPRKFKVKDAYIPAAKKLSSFGAGGRKSGTLGKTARNAKKPGGARGKEKKGKEQKEEEPWKNSYDWLYNLVEKTNKAIRDRNRLENDYNRLLKARVVTSDDLYENMEMQVRNLERQGDLLSEQRRKRLQERDKLTAEYSDVSQYARYNEAIGYVEIDWNKLEKLSGTVGNNEEAKRADEYIKGLEKIAGQIDSLDDSLYDIEDKIDAILELGKEEYLALEDRIFDAVRGAQQDLIDEMSAINDSINSTNSRILSRLQEDIADRRREREDARIEEDISTKEARLAFLRQDTSGANQLEIMKLEEELAQARQDYTDKLIDDKISELQKQNDAAAEQRQLQIELAQHQLEIAEGHGLLWEEVRRLTAEGVDISGTLLKDSELADLLRKQEGFKGMSGIQKMNWTSELEKQIGLAATYIRANDKTLDSIFKVLKPTTIAKEPAKSTTATSSKNTSGTGGGSTSGAKKTESSYYPKTTPAQVRAKGLDPNSLVDTLKAAGIDSSGTNRVKIAKANNIPGYKVTPYNAAHNTRLLKLLNQGKLKRYKKGGLIDFTGPAWVDGSKTDPESILDARDTQNLIALRDTLESLRRSQGGGDVHGDNYFDIKVHVDSIADDYDVDDLTRRIKKQIYDDASYRNVQVIRGLR